MSEVIDIEEGRFQVAVRKGFRNWNSRFAEKFDEYTKISEMSFETISFLAQGKEKAPFYIYDLIMNIREMGSGFDFYELSPNRKMAVIDQYLFLLDRFRFECMKRLGWIRSYPGEDSPLAELIVHFERLGPELQSTAPVLSEDYPGYSRYREMNLLDKEAFIRKLIPRALKKAEDYSTNL